MKIADYYMCIHCRDKGEYKVPNVTRKPNRELSRYEEFVGYWEDYCDCQIGQHLKLESEIRKAVKE